MKIDITQGNAQNIPIVYKNCTTGVKRLSNSIVEVINDDLRNSGMFDISENTSSINCNNVLDLISSSLINHEASILYTVSVKKIDNDNSEIFFDAYDIITRKHLVNKNIIFNSVDYRKVAHSFSDLLYEKLTGENGYFSTKISYIAEIPIKRAKDRQRCNQRRVALMDYDGHNVEFITSGDTIVGTPRLSSDQKKIVYISFDENFFSNVYLYDIKKERYKVIGNFIGGVSYAPRFSPDARNIILSRTNGTLTDLFLLNLKTGAAKKLTMKTAINTSASYSYDGKNVIFISDRAGAPKIYMMDIDGSNQKRVTYGKGSYFSPVCSPKEDLIAFVKVKDRKSYVGVIKSDGTGERLLTSGGILGSPTWSPNSRSIVFTRKEILGNRKHSKSRIYMIDVNGKREREIITPHDAQEVSWS
ncbi:hypothetical protein GUI12_03115 [Anaplasmataceae bacterium AB001_6]|nr:hypothetical protein GUI12_03115 [Anaplasmataceae bacterium AB001_6]